MSAATDPDYFFVYGTLRSDIPSSMSKFLGRRARRIGPAAATGYLIDLGGYPGFVVGEGTVRGELFTIKPEQAGETWQLLDAYEGVTGSEEEEYRRDTVAVRVAGRSEDFPAGDTVMAQTYVYQQPVGGRQVIPDGDYPRFYAGNPAHQKFTGH